MDVQPKETRTSSFWVRANFALRQLFLADNTVGDEEPPCIIHLHASRDVYIEASTTISVPSVRSGLLGPFAVCSVKHPRPSHAFKVHFEIPQHTFSALKIDQLRLTGETYKPYKGMRVRSDGDIEWRW